MEQRIIEPLHEDYKEITIRTTNLESFYMCPFKYKYETKKSDSYPQFVFGRLVHTAVQGFLVGKKIENNFEDVLYNNELKENILKLYELQNPYGFKVKDKTEKAPEHWVTIDRIRTYLDLLQEYYKKTKFILSEFSVGLEIHYGKYKIIISGGLDLITSDFSVVDLKTAAQAWKEESIQNKLQKIIYLYAMYLITKNPKIYFEYVILRTDLKKEKSVKLQTVKTHVDVPAIEHVLSSIIKDYTFSIDTNMFPTKQGDGCRYCGLGPRGNKECPVFDKGPIYEQES